MGRNQQSTGGKYAGNKGNNAYASGGKVGGGNKKSVDAATALGLGAPPWCTEHDAFGRGRTGNGATTSPGLTFGSMETNAMTGLGASLQSANGGNNLLQLAVLLGLSAAECYFSTCSAPSSATGACTAACNAARGTASGNTETNRGRSHEASGGACKN